MAARKRSRSGKSKGRSPASPLTPRGYHSVGHVVSGFDHYGYPMVRNMRLPNGFELAPRARKYAAAEAKVRPMRIAIAPPPGAKPTMKPGIAYVGDFKIKPSPSVPAAPADLPSQFKFCVQKGNQGYFYRFRDAKTSLHGAEANVLGCEPSDMGMMLCTVQMPGSSRIHKAPLCEEIGVDKEPVPADCCVKILGDTSGQIVCPGSDYDLLLVEIVTLADVNGVQFASVSHPDLPGGGIRLAVCEPMDETPEERPCCIEEGTGLVVCPEGIEFPLANMRIPLQYLEFGTDDLGERVAKLRCGDIEAIDPSVRAEDQALDAMWSLCEEMGGFTFSVCKRPGGQRPKRPTGLTARPPKVPDICCYDPETGKLVCEGTRFHDLPVDVVTEVEVAGKSIVSVASDSLPGGGTRVQVCSTPPEVPELPPAECCVMESEAGLSLLCDPQNHPWHQKNVTGLGECFDTPAGRMCLLKWEDRYGSHVLEVPVCPPRPDTPDMRPPPPVRPPDMRPPQPPTPPPVRPPDMRPPQPPTPPEPEVAIPPMSRPPAADCETEEARRCQEKWDAMMRRPNKTTACDLKFRSMAEYFRNLKCGPGRRAGSDRKYACASSRRYGTGISDEHKKYARFPGLRGGRRVI